MQWGIASFIVLVAMATAWGDTVNLRETAFVKGPKVMLCSAVCSDAYR